MHRPYKTRQGGCTVTVFVPYDCNNHCPFCVNKGEYADMTGFSLEKICESIEVMVPSVNTDKCLGCGACEHLCPSRPFSAIYVEGRQRHN